MNGSAPLLLAQTLIAIPVGLAVLMLALAIVWAAWHSIATLWGTVCWALSGEGGSLHVEGFRTGGARQRRTLELHRVITHVGLAIKAKLPLAPALKSAASGEARRVRNMLEGLAEYLEAGGTLSRGFQTAIPGCPALVVALLEHGEESGQVPAVVENIDAMYADRILDPSDTVRSGRPAVWIALVTMMVACATVGGVLTWVIPKFRDIFDDFDVEIPGITETLVTIYPAALMSLVVLLGLTLIAAAILSFEGLARTRGRPGLLARGVAWVRWLLPATRRIDFGGGMALVASQLAMLLKAGLPLDGLRGLATLLSPANYLWWRVEAFEQALRAGRAPDDAARQAELGTVMVSALTMIARGEPVDSVLGHAVEYYEAIARRWRSAVAAVIEPAATLLAAGVVLFVMLALFVPLVALINGVLETM